MKSSTTPGAAEQRGQLIAGYWSNAPALHCPCCQRVLQFAFRSTASYALDIRCPGECDATTIGLDDDPMQGRFRPWTADEEVRIVHDHPEGHMPTCPLCDNGVFVSLTPTRSGTLVTAQCGRCGNRVEKQGARSGR